MNKNRRSDLEKIAEELNKHLEMLKQAELKISDLLQDLEGVQFDEEWYHDNIPENLQNSEKALASEEALDHISDALSSLQDGLESIGEAIESIEAAAQ